MCRPRAAMASPLVRAVPLGQPGARRQGVDAGRRWLVIWSGTRCLVLALAASGVLPGVVDRGDPVGAEPGVVLDGVEADLVAVRVVQMGQNPADAGPVHPGVPPAQRDQPGSELVDRLRALPSVSTRARIASWLRSRTWCFSPTAGRRCSSVRNAAWSAGASPQPPVAANQALFGAVTKMIGAIHGRGSVTLASIFELPAMLALKLPVLTLSTVAVFPVPIAWQLTIARKSGIGFLPRNAAGTDDAFASTRPPTVTRTVPSCFSGPVAGPIHPARPPPASPRAVVAGPT